MRLSAEKVRALANGQSRSLSAVLREAAVSRTAFYSLARRRSLLPRTVYAVAEALGVRASDVLDSPDRSPEELMAARLADARAMATAHPTAAFENIWHTLALLDLPPIDRLNRSLLRGRAITVHR
jgi:hypothetical protein